MFRKLGGGELPGDGYYNDRQGFDPNRRGQIFETGSDRHFRDRENGYVPDSRKYEHGSDKIQFDKVKVENGQMSTIEDKSGRIGGPKDEKQLEVVYELIKKGEIKHHTLRSVEREVVSERCQQIIDKIREEFPNKFTHLQISRADARAIWARGVELERSKQLEKEGKAVQLELPGVAQKAREQKGVDLQKRRDKQVMLAKAREAREKFQAVQRFSQGAERGRAEAPQRIQAERAEQAQERAERAKTRETPQAERDRATRAVAEKAVQEVQARLTAGSTPAGKAPEKATPERAERTAADKARETAAQQREAEAREAARKQAKLDQARDAAYREMLNQPQVPEHVRLALSHAQAPEAAVRTPPGQAPSVQRGGRGPDARGIERTR
ncbi:hypothetical protein ACQPW1_40465 [Nocardia sp. CA-128927]|uniref:hypothetical protein n=1 Tax=Nocardia sp. CA-128927 TaxID=3239975 RepID=UPI003D97967D